MKNFPVPILRYWSRCQAGIPVHLRDSGSGQAFLKPGDSSESQQRYPLLYVRLNQPTGRLLLHFLRTEAGSQSPFLRDGMLRLPQGAAIAPELARSLGLPAGRHRLRAGKYPLLTDERFRTASAELVRAQRPAAPPTESTPSLAVSAR